MMLNVAYPYFLSAMLIVISSFGLAEDTQIPNVTFIVTDTHNQQLPCRIMVKNTEGKPQKAINAPFWYDQFVCEGTAQLKLQAGRYTYRIEKGPEFERIAGNFTLTDNSSVKIRKHIKRMINMAELGWYGGDLHNHRKEKHMKLLMRVEDIYITPVITWWGQGNPWLGKALPKSAIVQFDSNRFYYLLGGEDERAGGAFLFYNMEYPIDITWAKEKDYPSGLRFIEQALWQPNAWIDIEKPFWWDVPVALAHGFGDSIGIANNHCFHYGMLDDEVWGKHRNRKHFPSPLGNAKWCQYIYYHILNSGIRIPPSAGSASGALDNPLGYNRIYVHLDKPLTYASWWAALKEGKCFVTNSPLLQVQANGKLPGHIFQTENNTSLDLNITASLFCNDPVSTIEIIKNGVIVKTILVSELNKTASLGTLQFKKSGWFLIRAVADIDYTYRFASTGPYYVEIGQDKRLISRQSVQFFIDWIHERLEKIEIEEDWKKKEVLIYHHRALDFWQNQLKNANADLTIRPELIN